LRQSFPRLYAIADRDTLEARGIRLACFARELARSGVGIVQYRDKHGSPQQILEAARTIEQAYAAFAPAGMQCVFVMNDRADLAALAGWGGVHVGHTDMPPEAVRAVLGEQARCIGVSTHNDAQVQAADAGTADYIAVGPVFATSTKADAEPVIGLEGVRRARALTRKPIVAIGGITLENARSVLDAGADSVAVISGLLRKGERPGKVAEDFLHVLR
jgi:thiamine-phosphate pyrophosphorylase